MRIKTIPGTFFWALTVLLVPLFGAGPVSSAEPPGLAYEATIEGLEEDDVVELLQSASDTFSLQERPPISMAHLRSRVRGDLAPMLQALESMGYFKADLSYHIETEEEPVRVVFQIDPGPRFDLAEVQIRSPEPDGEETLPTLEEIELEEGEGFVAQDVLDAREAILQNLGQKGYPFPQVLEMDVVADHAKNTVSVTYVVAPGPKAQFGDTTIKGLDDVEPEYARELIPWEKGDEFQASLLRQARENFLETGLFGGVEIDVEEDVEGQGLLPTTITVKESKYRAISAGIGYTTDFGFGISLGWEHRNLFGEAEFLDAELSINQVEQELRVTIRKPQFFHDDQRLLLQTSLSQEDTDAYKARRLSAIGQIERSLTENIVVGAGVGYDFLREEEDGDTDTFGFLTFPLSLGLDYSDDILDPSRGFTFDGLLVPYLDTLGGKGTNFLKYDLAGNKYLQILKEKRLILALRARYGQILWGEREDLPASERFYAGGGGSVRGYPFQSLSPLNEDEDPVGGLSVVELVSELRLKITEKIGMVAFLDGGRAYEGDTPDLGEKLFWGTGIGLRYFTPIGPIRLDVAIPLEERVGVDDDYQIYISIGQAF